MIQHPPILKLAIECSMQDMAKEEQEHVRATAQLKQSCQDQVKHSEGGWVGYCCSPQNDGQKRFQHLDTFNQEQELARLQRSLRALSTPQAESAHADTQAQGQYSFFLPCRMQHDSDDA